MSLTLRIISTTHNRCKRQGGYPPGYNEPFQIRMHSCDLGTNGEQDIMQKPSNSRIITPRQSVNREENEMRLLHYISQVQEGLPFIGKEYDHWNI